MGDYIVRATAAGGQVRAFATTTKGLVEEAKERHNMSPIATVALGRLLTGGAMMGAMMKNDADILTVQIKGNGPIGSMTVTANPKGEVKGFVGNPQVMLPLKDGKLDIADAVGIGVLSVIKDIGLKEPYVGDTILITSEIADDPEKPNTVKFAWRYAENRIVQRNPLGVGIFTEPYDYTFR